MKVTPANNVRGPKMLTKDDIKGCFGAILAVAVWACAWVVFLAVAIAGGGE